MNDEEQKAPEFGDEVTRDLSPDSLVGKQIGAYEILQRIGVGGMANVYLAKHKQIGRDVALKCLHPHMAQQPGMVSRFFLEARVVNKVRHRNVIEITDFIENEDGYYCYIMELLEGRSLESLLQEVRFLPLRLAIEISYQLASALHAVEQAKLVHRDLKPANVFLARREGEDDVVKLLDFGVVKSNDANLLQDGNQTRAGIIVGTPTYMSPEQARGEFVDTRTDIYAFGIVMYEMLTGKNPFAGRTTVEILSNQIYLNPEAPSRNRSAAQAVPPAVDAIVLSCLAKTASERPQSFSQVVAALRDIRAHLGGTPPPGALRRDLEQKKTQVITPVPFAQPVARNRRVTWIGASAITLALVGVLTLVGVFGGDDQVSTTSSARAAPPLSAEPVAGPVPGPATIEITIESRPSGAEVFTPDDESLGMTPLKLSWERGDGLLELTFKLEGYDDVTQHVALDESTTVSAKLERTFVPKPKAKGRVSKKPQPPKERRRSSVDMSATKDPFQ